MHFEFFKIFLYGKKGELNPFKCSKGSWERWRSVQRTAGGQLHPQMRFSGLGSPSRPLFTNMSTISGVLVPHFARLPRSWKALGLFSAKTHRYADPQNTFRPITGARAGGAGWVSEGLGQVWPLQWLSLCLCRQSYLNFEFFKISFYGGNGVDESFKCNKSWSEKRNSDQLGSVTKLHHKVEFSVVLPLKPPPEPAWEVSSFPRHLFARFLR